MFLKGSFGLVCVTKQQARVCLQQATSVYISGRILSPFGGKELGIFWGEGAAYCIGSTALIPCIKKKLGFRSQSRYPLGKGWYDVISRLGISWEKCSHCCNLNTCSHLLGCSHFAGGNTCSQMKVFFTSCWLHWKCFLGQNWMPPCPSKVDGVTCWKIHIYNLFFDTISNSTCVLRNWVQPI